MTSSALLLILVGIFVILNSANFVKVIKGEAKISFLSGSSSNGISSGQGAGSTTGG